MMRHKKRRKKNNTLAIGLIAVLSVLLIVAIIIALILDNANTPQPTAPSQSETSASEQQSEDITEETYLEDGWHTIDGMRYYYEYGLPYTGWLDLEDGTYYFHNDNGQMATGNVKIAGINYAFSSEGKFFHVVNPWNSILQDYTPDLIELPKSYGEDQFVDSSCYEALVRMIDDCNTAMKGETQAYVISAYRSQAKQTANFNNKVSRVMADNPSLSREEAEDIAATVVARPGTSEHQLGLAVDIIDTQLWALEEEQENLPAQKWLMENSWRYGFLLRYPKGTTDSTGIIYEPWHYRYLGIDLATEIHNSGMTVEQYLDSLS